MPVFRYRSSIRSLALPHGSYGRDGSNWGAINKGDSRAAGAQKATFVLADAKQVFVGKSAASTRAPCRRGADRPPLFIAALLSCRARPGIALPGSGVRQGYCRELGAP